MINSPSYRPMSGELLAASFILVADRTGKELSRESIDLYLDYFGSLHLMPEAVIQAMKEIAISWNGYGWPTAEYIAIRAQQLQRQVLSPNNREMERHHDEGLLEYARRWDSRKQMARAWAEVNPKLADDIHAKVASEIDVLVKRSPDGMLATNEQYRKEYRNGSMVGAMLFAIGKEARAIAKERAEKMERAKHITPEPPQPVSIGEVIAA